MLFHVNCRHLHAEGQGLNADFLFQCLHDSTRNVLDILSTAAGLLEVTPVQDNLVFNFMCKELMYQQALTSLFIQVHYTIHSLSRWQYLNISYYLTCFFVSGLVYYQDRHHQYY
ncbi:hypothetical protein ACJX0J_035513 [Zea mays]